MTFVTLKLKNGKLSVEGKVMASLCRMRRKSAVELLGVAFSQKHARNIRRWYRQILMILDEEDPTSFRMKNLGPHVFPPKVKQYM